MIDYKTLTKQTQQGDMTSAYALYLATLKPIFYTVLKQTSNDARAEYLVRDAYISAIKFISYLNHPESFPVWVQMIATKNTAAYLANRKKLVKGSINVPLNTEWNQNECDALEIQESLAKRIWEDILKGLDGEELEAALVEDNGMPPVDQDKLDEILVELGKAKHKERKKKWIVGSVVALALVAAVIGSTFFSNRKTTPKHNIGDIADLYQNVSNALVAKFANQLSGQLDGQIGEIYQISDNTYYLLIYINNEPSGSMLVEYQEKKNAGDTLHIIAKKDEAISKVEAEAIVKDQYLNVNYNNNKGNALENAINAAGTTEVETSNNATSIDEKLLNSIIENSEAERNKLQDIFGIDAGQQDLNIVLTVKCRNVDLTKPVTVNLDSSIADMIGNSGELKILLNDDQHWIMLSRDQINKLCSEHKSVEVIIKADNNRSYNINFRDPEKKEIEQLYGDVIVGIPCEHELSYVYATYSSGGSTYAEGGENRRGTFDEKSKTISFPVSHSGKYELIGEETELFDINDLNEETKRAVEFAASMGYIPATANGYFKPNDTITRGILMEALGKMFLTTDKNYKVYFTDVNPDDPDYDYIAAGWNNEIIYGYNGNFNADLIASNEDMLTLCMKTLVACDYIKAKNNIEEAREQITYIDKNNIADYALSPVASAIEAKIVDGKGALYPKNNATRAFAALVLYHMYMLDI